MTPLNITSDIDSIVLILFGTFFFGILNYSIFKKFNSVELCISISSITISMYILTILPAGKTLQNFLILIIFFIFSVYTIFKIDFKEIVFIKSTNLSSDNYLLITFLLIYLFSAVVINFQDVKNVYGFSKAVTFIICPLFYCYYLPRVYSKNTKMLSFTLNYLIYLGLITGIFGILFYFFKINEIPSATNASLSFFRHPNTTAFVYTLTGPIVLYFLLFEKKHITITKKLFLIFCLLIIYTSLLLTISRAGYLAISVSTVIMLIYYRNKLILFLLAFFVIIFSTFFLSLILSKGSVSTISRLGLIYSAIEMLRSSLKGFLWGFGSTSVFETFTEFKYQLGPLLEDVAYPHNFILFFIMQFGIIAFIVILIYFFQLTISTFTLLKKQFEENKFLILPISIIVSLFFQSLLEDTLLFPDFFVFHIFLFFFGILVFSRKNSEMKNFTIAE